MPTNGFYNVNEVYTENFSNLHTRRHHHANSKTMYSGNSRQRQGLPAGVLRQKGQRSAAHQIGSRAAGVRHRSAPIGAVEPSGVRHLFLRQRRRSHRPGYHEKTRFCSPHFKLVWKPTILYSVRAVFSARSCTLAQGRWPVRGSRRPTGRSGP